MTHEHLTPRDGVAYSVNRAMAEDTGENGQPQEINSRADADQFAAAAKEAQDKSLNQIRESLKSQGWSDEVADRIARGLAQEEARVDEETETLTPAAGAGGAGDGEGVEPPGGGTPTAGTPEEPERPPPLSRREEQEERFREMVSLFGEHEIKEELMKDNPDFSKHEMMRLRNLLEKDVHPVGGLLVELAEYVARLRAEDGEEGQKQISRNSKELIFEWLVERIIGLPDKGSPDARYRDSVGGFRMQGDLDELRNLSQTYFEPKFTQYIQELIHVREVSHELNRSFKSGDAYKKYIAEELAASGLDFMQNELAGAGSVLRLYEKITSQKVAEKKTWLSPEDIYDIDQQVKDLFGNLCREGAITKEGRKLTDWEIARSLRLSKILFSGSQRLAMYSVIGDLPEDWTERIASIPLEFVARNLILLKIIGARFFGDPGQLRLLELIAEELDKVGQYSLDRNKKDSHRSKKGLFGFDEKTMMFNNSGVYDPESHSWRMPLLFLSNIDIRQDDGTVINLKDYIANAATRHGGGGESLFGGVRMSDATREAFSREVEDYVLGQKLYLSVLQKYGDFSKDLKTKTWRKIATYKPSTIVALLGREKVFDALDDEEVWEALKTKLYTSEERRVEDESRRYGDEDNPYTAQELKEEAALFRDPNGNVDPRVKYQMIENIEGITDAERDLLRRIIDKGYENADLLAGASTTYTYAVDDVARISWSRSESGGRGAGTEDLLRLLFSDQNNLGEAWGQINSLIESPTGNFIEFFQKAVDGYASVHGRENAQVKFEPFIIAFFNFASTKESILWKPGAMTVSRLFRKPTSEIEEYYRSSFISLDEQDKADALTALAQAKAISDRVVGLKDGVSQLDKIRKRTKSDRLSLALRMARIIIMMFGPVAGYEFLKVLLPPDILKALG